MIADSSEIVLVDGTVKPAIEVSEAAVLTTPRVRRGTAVVAKKVENRGCVICLMLSTGKTLTGTRGQLVGFGPRRYKVMADIEVGDRLTGYEGGTKTVVRVVGIEYHDWSTRLVGIQTAGREPYVAEGVVCRS